MCLVQRESSDDKKVGKLLDRLPHCGPDAFDKFASALRDTGQGHAADIITEPESVDNQPPNVPHDSRTPDGIPQYSGSHTFQCLLPCLAGLAGAMLTGLGHICR